MMRWFKNLWWKLKYPWSRAVIEGLCPLHISACPDSHLSECERLFDENVAHGVPADHRDRYCADLRRGEILILEATHGNQVIGTFGVQYRALWKNYVLCYLMVSPQHHRQGVGTTMFFAALALLPEDHPHLYLCISALPHAQAFYDRLGFTWVGEDKHSSGQIHRLGVLHLWAGTSKRCRAWLSAAGVHLPDGCEIPTERLREKETTAGID